MVVILVLFGGGIGAAARFGIGQWMGLRVSTLFPAGTLAVNVLGCLFMGFLTQSPWFSTPTLLLLEVGLVGALTTFSTFSYETLRLLEEREFGHAFLNMAVSLILGLGALTAGSWLGQVMG